MKALIFSFINFGLLVAFLVWKARKPLLDYVAERAAVLKKEVDSVSELLLQAKTQSEEFSAKLKAIEAEVISLRQAARVEAEQMKKQLIEEARRLAVIIVADSKHAAEAAGVELRDQLRAELAIMVVQTAETQIRARLTGDDRARMRQEFSRKVETVA